MYFDTFRRSVPHASSQSRNIWCLSCPDWRIVNAKQSHRCDPVRTTETYYHAGLIHLLPQRGLQKEAHAAIRDEHECLRMLLNQVCSFT